jgi:hypothetical protein
LPWLVCMEETTSCFCSSVLFSIWLLIWFDSMWSIYAWTMNVEDRYVNPDLKFMPSFHLLSYSQDDKLG